MGENRSSKTHIKEMAEKLGLSPGTVSVVLNGRGDSVRIAKETQKKIMELAREMNYQPNIYARRLRKAGQEQAPIIISIFWRKDNLNSRIGKFLAGLYAAIVKKGCNVEMMVQPYEPGEFKTHMNQIHSSRCSGVMIGGLTAEEQICLEQQDYDIPVILIGRNTEKFHCVLMDNYRAGEKCAAAIDPTRIKSAAVIAFQKGSRAERLMEAGFTMACQDRGITIREDWKLRMEKSSYEIGYHAVEVLLETMTFPAAWMVMDSRLAGGMLAACQDNNIVIPSDLNLIFFEDSELLKYNKPSLTSVDVPVEEMAEKALDILLLVSENKVDIPIKRELLPVYHMRESIGEPL